MGGQGRGGGEVSGEELHAGETKLERESGRYTDKMSNDKTANDKTATDKISKDKTANDKMSNATKQLKTKCLMRQND